MVARYSTLQVNEVHPLPLARGGLGRGISVPHKVEICCISSAADTLFVWGYTDKAHLRGLKYESVGVIWTLRLGKI
jgi:hypothetical protein